MNLYWNEREEKQIKRRNHKTILLLSLLLAIILAFSGCSQKQTDGDTAVVKPEEVTEVMSEDGVKLSNDASDFVLLTDAVPDAILEIRYYSTYNFVGERIDGYEEPIALITKEAAAATTATAW